MVLGTISTAIEILGSPRSLLVNAPIRESRSDQRELVSESVMTCAL